MFIYNVTIKVQNDIVERWLLWLKEEHIPEMIRTGCFTKAVILHLLESNDEEGETYAVQYHTNTQKDYQRYIETHSSTLRQKGLEKWGNKFISFRTIMEVVN